MRFVTFSFIVFLVGLSSPASAQRVVSEATCRAMGYLGSQKLNISPGVYSVLQSQPRVMQCGYLYRRGDVGLLSPATDAGAAAFLESVVTEAESPAYQAKIERLYKDRERNQEKAKARKKADPAKFVVSLVFDAHNELKDLEAKIKELKRVSERQDVAFGKVVLLGMEELTERRMEKVLNSSARKLPDKARKKAGQDKKQTTSDLINSSKKQQILVQQAMNSSIERLIIKSKLRRKGTASGVGLLAAAKAERLPVWLIFSKDNSWAFDGAEQLSSLFTPFGEVDESRVIESEKASRAILRKASHRDWAFIEDEISPNAGSYLGIPGVGGSGSISTFGNRRGEKGGSRRDSSGSLGRF